ncbi:MAG: RluA family pseudouridine synthase [Saprospiraceae bacterium]|nr:RluA family pseudouridine synthase [Saprospiraceae bacterium]
MKHLTPEILFEDQYLLAVNKPAGILTIPDRFNPALPNLISSLKEKYPELIPVHRLDKYTSGVNLFAKAPETHRLMSIAFESRDVEKYYYAIIDGIPSPESGTIDIPLSESTVTRGKMLVHQRGKASITDYKVVRNFKNFSLVYIRIHTGRMHQVRVHMQYLGNPLIVDPLYGHREAFYLSEIKHKKFNLGKAEEERPLLTRQPLHAEKLIIIHPYTGVKTEITSPLPKDMQAVLSQMEKWIK